MTHACPTRRSSYLRNQQLESRLMAASSGRLGRLRVRSPMFGFPLFLESSAMVAPGVALVSDAAHRVHPLRSEEHTSELQSLMRISYAVFCLKKNNFSII